MRGVATSIVFLAFLVLGIMAQTPFCTADTSGVEAYETLVDSIATPFSLQVLQLPPDNKIVLMLATGVLYRSTNYGQTFDKVPSTMGTYFSGIMQTASSSTIFATDAASSTLWLSTNSGDSFTPLTYDRSKYYLFVDYCDPHPTKSSYLLCMSLNPKFPASSKSRYQLVVSQDTGATWSVVSDFVSTFQWAYDPEHPTRVPEDAIFMSRVVAVVANKEQQNYHRPDYAFGEYVLSTKKWTTKIEGCPVFFYTDGEFVAPQYYTKAQNGVNNVVLKTVWHSTDHGQQWVSYSFPINIYVLGSWIWFAEDKPIWGYPFYVTNNATFFITMDLTRDKDNAIQSCYVSDNQDHGYSKAIDRIKGYDVAPFESINGIFVANHFADSSAQKNDVAQTLITYDNGGTWYPISPPSGSTCPPGTSPCHLNLLGSSDSMFGRFYSWYDAIGLMIGTGNLGREVDPESEVNTYLTADGGFTWQQIRDGPTTYEFGDHGSLMVFADAGQESSNIVFSWNGGNTFSECSITDKAFDMYNIITGNASSTQFWVYGSRTVNNVTRGVVILLDFSQFHERTCEESDYEKFTPSTPDNTSCILGLKTSYTRRKLDADCFNPAGFESETSQVVCPCGADDYECGYCYEYSPLDNSCHWACDQDEKGKPPADCIGVWYPKSNGWRLVPGTECNLEDPRAVKRLGAPQLCPDSGPSSTTTMIVLVVLFVVILLTILAAIGFIAYSQNDSVKRWVNEKFNQAPADSFSLPESALGDKGPLTADE